MQIPDGTITESSNRNSAGQTTMQQSHHLAADDIDHKFTTLA